MSEREASHLPEAQRKDVFLALVEAQDGGMSVQESRRYVAERFSVTEGQVRLVEREGMENDWPPL